MQKALFLALALVLAPGCSDAGSQADAMDGQGTGPTAGGGAPGTDGNGTEEVLPPVPSVWHATADGVLVDAVGSEPESYALPSAHTFMIEGPSSVDFYAGQWNVLPYDLHITSARITVYVRHESVGVQTFPNEVLDADIAALLGTEDVQMPFVFLSGPDVLQGNVVEMSSDFGLPAGGLVLRAGVAPTLFLGSMYSQVDALGQTTLLMNSPETDTRVELEAAWIDLPATTAPSALSETVEVTGDACNAGDAAESDQASLDLEVPADAVGALVHALRTGGTATGNTDIDLRVLDSSGNVVATSHRPFDRETVELYLPNIKAAGTGTWTIVVVSCAPQQAEVAVSAQVLLPAFPAST